MPHRRIILIVLLASLPMVGLTIGGWRLYQNEEVAQDMQETQQIRQQQARYNKAVTQYFETLVNTFSQELAELPKNSHATAVSTEQIDAYRQLSRSHTHIRQVFVANRHGELLFPETGMLSNNEQAFLQRTQGLWSQEELGNILRNHQLSQLEMGLGSREFDSNGGWHRWYNGGQQSWLYWTKNGREKVIGIELSSARLLADIIGFIAEQADHSLNPIRIKDERDNLLLQSAQWAEISDSHLIRLPLIAPLGHWHLEYQTMPGNPKFLALIFALLIVTALSLGLLCWIIQREFQRNSRLARQRVSFVNQVSHELKTPLTNIRMYAELLESDLADEDSQQRRYAQVISGESERLSRMVLNVLNFSREEKGQMKLAKRQECVDELINEAIERFRPGFTERGIELRSTLNAVEPIFVDRDAFQQIMDNLLSNVEKYGASDATFVEISSQQTASETIISIRDYGPGIPHKEQEKIFEAFYRLDNSLTASAAGSGIGLSVSRSLARQHKGDLTVESAQPGARFVLRLPNAES